MMVIFNHINLHITFYGHKPMATEMSTELHGRMKLGASEYRIEVPSNVQPCVATLIDRQCVALQLGSA